MSGQTNNPTSDNATDSLRIVTHLSHDEIVHADRSGKLAELIVETTNQIRSEMVDGIQRWLAVYKTPKATRLKGGTEP